MVNEICRYGRCKPETKHIKLNSNARFICLKSKTILFLFFRNVMQRSTLTFIFVKTCDFSLQGLRSKFFITSGVEWITELCQGKLYLL